MLIGARIRCAYPAVVLYTVVWSIPAHGVELTLQPLLSVGTRATDNLRSSPTEEEAAWGFDTGGGLILDAKAERWSSLLNPHFNVRRFVIGENADAEEYGVTTQHQTMLTERAIGELTLDYLRDSTLTSELTDVGRRTDILDRDMVTVRPTFTYLLAETTQLTTGFLFNDVSFEDRVESNHVDYDYKQADLGVSHRLTAVLTLISSVYVSEYRAPAAGSESRTAGARAGASYRFSDEWQADADVGYSYSDIDFLELVQTGVSLAGLDPLTGAPIFVPQFSLRDATTHDQGVIARAGISREFESCRANLDYNRAVSPSSRGAQTTADEIELNLERNLSPHLTLGLRSFYKMQNTQVDDAGARSSILNRDQVMLSGTVRYKLSATTSFNAAYRFFWNDPSKGGPASYSNGVFISVNYRGAPRPIGGF